MIKHALCNSYKQEILSGVHRDNHKYKIALFTSAAKLDKNTTTYTGQDSESEGPGYDKGGQVLKEFYVGLDGDTAFLDFNENPVWPSSTITARGAMIYNSSLPGKNAVIIINFGETFKSVDGDFKVKLPSEKGKALIRIQ